MDENKDINHGYTTGPHGVDDAVGVSAAKWFIAILNSRSEKKTAERLTAMGIENYLPTQQEVHLWQNGRKAKILRVMIPSRIFIRCTEQKRKELTTLPFINRFMTNKAATTTTGGTKPLATVPDNEIQQLKFMLGVPDAKVTFTEQFHRGDKVIVARGPFKGLQGQIMYQPQGSAPRLFINIDFLGSAYIEINANDVQPIGK